MLGWLLELRNGLWGYTSLVFKFENEEMTTSLSCIVLMIGIIIEEEKND